MAETFDPYYKWLGIPPRDQPPHHYRLLGIEVFEEDRDVIDAAANRLMGYLKDLAVGDETAYSQKLLNEIARARLCLLNREKKAAYDGELRTKLQPAEEPKPSEPRKPAAKGPPPRVAKRPTPPDVPALPPDAASPRAEAKPPVAAEAVLVKPVAASPLPFFIQEEDAADGAEGEAAQEPEVVDAAAVWKSLAMWTAIGALGSAVVVGGLLVAVALLSQGSPKHTPRGKRAKTEVGEAPVVMLMLTEDERSQITAFSVDDVPQELPPKLEYTLEPGRHRLLLRRPGYQEVFDTITLVRGVRREYRPRWKTEQEAAPPAAKPPPLGELDRNFQSSAVDSPRGGTDDQSWATTDLASTTRTLS